MLRRLLDSPWTYFISAGLLVAVGVASQFDLSIPSRSKATVEDIKGLAERDDLNVIFILVDTLRADRMGIYGYERDTTPVMDDLARHGIVFRHVIAQSSWTKTSMASLWTATNPARNGVHRYNHAVPQEAQFPAEIFSAAGFRTAGIWRNAWVAVNFGFGQGFDTYVKPGASRDRVQLHRSSPSSRSLRGIDMDTTDSAEGFLRNFGHERFMLYIHLMDLHQYIYDDRAPDYGNSYSDAYDKSLNWIDRVVGQFIYKVDELGLLDKTVIVIASDHGEAFQEHGFEGHARNLYREVVEVPLIVVLPFLLEPPGITVDTVVGNIDIWPTILELVGLPPLEGVDGVSLLPLILGAGGAASPGSTEGLKRPIFSQIDRRWGNASMDPDPLVSVTDEGRRAFIPINRPDRAEFFDWADDRDERKNLAKARPEELEHFREMVDAYVADDNPPWQERAGTVVLEEMQINQLKALGYQVGN